MPLCVVVQGSAAAVGYQNKAVNGTTDGGITTIASTLPGVGSDLDKLTLAEFKVVSPEGGLWSSGSVELKTFDSAGQIAGDFYYLDEVTCGDFGVDPGWYTAESVEEWDPVSADTEIIAFGTGVMIFSDCGATVTFAGEVLGQSITFTINGTTAGGITVTGNTSPVDLTLKDISITSPEGGLWSSGSVELKTFDDAGQIEGDFYYLDDVTCGDFGVDPGWYTAESVEEWDPVSAVDEPIAAGRMFMILSDCGASITIPSALPTSAK